MSSWSLFSKKKAVPASRSASIQSQRQTASPNSLRREIVTVALRGTLTKHGIPASWVGIEIQSSLNNRGEFNSYVRLVLRHWEPRLLQYTVAFQNSLSKRIFLLDATAHSWLRGIGWHFVVPDESACPSMPPSSAWGPPVEIAAAKSSADRKAQLNDLLRSGDEFGASRYGSADFQNTVPFDNAEPQQPGEGDVVAFTKTFSLRKKVAGQVEAL